MQRMRKEELVSLYRQQKLSSTQIAERKGCSASTINYWLRFYKIPKRSISDAVYERHNPNGDPFSFRRPSTYEGAFLYGLGVGLYWGEGTKSNPTSVRLGNSNPRLIKKFVDFLVTIYQVDKAKIRFGLQIFGDMEQRQVVSFWKSALAITDLQIMKKVVVTPHRGVGNYREKTKYGVITIYFNNRKLRDILCDTIEKVATDKPM